MRSPGATGYINENAPPRRRRPPWHGVRGIIVHAVADAGPSRFADDDVHGARGGCSPTLSVMAVGGQRLVVLGSTTIHRLDLAANEIIGSCGIPYQMWQFPHPCPRARHAEHVEPRLAIKSSSCPHGNASPILTRKLMGISTSPLSLFAVLVGGYVGLPPSFQQCSPGYLEGQILIATCFTGSDITGAPPSGPNGALWRIMARKHGKDARRRPHPPPARGIG